MFCSIESLNITASRGASHEVIYYIVLERNEMQKIRSYGEEHHEGPAFGRTPDDDDIIKEYNTYMRGVDMLDAHISRCKFSIRSRRWYLKLFWHFISIGVINAWLLYRRHCALLGITGRTVLKLRKFQSMVAQGLIEVGMGRKCGRPSIEEETSPNPRKMV